MGSTECPYAAPNIHHNLYL